MSSIKFTETEDSGYKVPGLPVIKVVGLGGGGGNAVNFMKNSNIPGVNFICANTDAQALDQSPVEVRIQLGEGGLGAGAMPDRGRKFAEAHIDEIREQLQGVDMVFITAGMGGGTGTGSAPVFARVAREMGILTVGVVSMPFSFERRMKAAKAGVNDLAEHVDSLITVPNDKLLKVLGESFDFGQAFNYANEVLSDAVLGITELVTRPGIINVDFEDLRTVMSERGVAMMGAGIAEGENRAVKATQKAIANPLLEDIAVDGARGLLVNITTANNLTLGEFNQVGDIIEDVTDDEAVVIIGTSVDPEMNPEDIRVTVVATGLTEVNQDRNVDKLPKATINQRPTEQEQVVEPQAAVHQAQPAVHAQQAQSPHVQAPQTVAPNYTQPAVDSNYQTQAAPVQTPSYQTQSAPTAQQSVAQPEVVTPQFQQAAAQSHAMPNESMQPQAVPTESMSIQNDGFAQNQQQVNGAPQQSTMEMLDIPAFIRRQLD
nr:cell division protein FtsZ [Thiomicrorhabdus indica]